MLPEIPLSKRWYDLTLTALLQIVTLARLLLFRQVHAIIQHHSHVMLLRD